LIVVSAKAGDFDILGRKVKLLRQLHAAFALGLKPQCIGH